MTIPATSASKYTAPDVRVVRVRRPATIADGGIRRLILKAIEHTEYPGTTPQALYDELCRNISSDLLGLFVGFESGPKAVVGAVLPSSQVAFAPQVFIVYSCGAPALIRAVGERVRGWIMTAGYDSVTGVGLRHNPRAWLRALRFLGQTRELGSVVECRFR